MIGITAVFAVTLLVSPLAPPIARSSSPVTASLQQGGAEQELIALDKKIEDARLKADTAALGELMTDDFMQVTGAGVRTKAEALKALATPSPNLPAPVPANPPAPTYTVHEYGDTAVMTHYTKATDPHNPAPAVGVVHMFVRQQGRWKLAASGSAPAQPSAEQSINSAGYALMQDGKSKEAIDLLKTNVQLYPGSWNVYDSLGEAYANAGETALAIENYGKSVQLNPENTTGKAALTKLAAK